MYEEVTIVEDEESHDCDPLSPEKPIQMANTEVQDIKMYKIASQNKNHQKLEKYKKQAREMDLTYSKVIIPSNMRSRYWKYFGFPADDSGDIVTKDQIVCSLCNIPINFHKNTTNLRSHLQRHHKNVTFSDDEDYVPLSSSTSSKRQQQQKNLSKSNKKQLKNIENTKDTGYSSSAKIFPFKKIKIEHTALKSDVKKPKSTRNPLIETIASESDLLEAATQITAESIDYPDYGTNVEQQQQDYDVDRNDGSNGEGVTVTRGILPKLTASEVNLTDLIQQMITTDLFPLSICEGAGFINLIWTICGNVQIPEKKEIEASIGKLYQEKSTKLLQILQTHSSTQPFSLGVEIWHNTEKKTLVSIYFNYISPDAPTTFNNVLFTTVELSKYTNFEEVFLGINLRNCSAAVVNSYNNIVASFLSQYDITSVNCFDAVIQRCMKLTFNIPEIQSMFSEIHDLFYKHSDVLPDPTLIPRVDDSYPWTKYNLLKYFYDNVTFQDEENDLLLKIKTILECLQPFKLTLETLIDEPNAVCSLIKPLAFKLVEQHFHPRNGDYELAAKIKDIIGRELKQSLLSNNFLVVSSFLDPRFHSFINEYEMNAVYEALTKKATELPQKLSPTHNSVNLLKTESLIADTPKRSSLKLFFDDTQRTQSNHATKITIEQEITKYRTEVFTDLEQCPLDWWSKMGYVYGQMKLIADEFKCIPSCTNNNFKKTVEEQIDFNNRRLMLRGPAINELLFLHYNRKFLEQQS